MDAREAALRFKAGDRLQTAFLKKLAVVDRETVRELASFVGEPKVAPRVVRLVPATEAKAFFDAALERWSDATPRVSQPTAWARHHRNELARAVLRALFEVSERRAKRALEFLQALLSSDEPDEEWGDRARRAVASFGVERVKDLATKVFEIAEGGTLAALLADRLVWLAVHSARGPDAIRALVEDARRDARSGSTRPRAAIAVAKALRGVDPALARPELERMKVRIRHRVVLREIEASLAVLGEGPEPDLPANARLDAAGELVFEEETGTKAERSRIRRAAQELLSVQRALLEQHMIHERTWPLPSWRTRFENHRLLADLARRLVWLADGEPVLYAGTFHDLHGREVTPATLQVAHPVHIRELDLARKKIAESGLSQPWRQLDRETYVVTRAEEPEVSCLRFLNEIVPDDALYALTKQRGWSGLFFQEGEGSTEGTKLFANDWRARLSIHEARHSLGVCLGELTFETKVKREVTVHPLRAVPPVVFSEACRDLDLVVGVASIGEDRIENIPATVADRREIIAKLLPALGLGERARLAGRYVIVKGELNDYRVHVGSAQVHALPSERAIVFGDEISPELHLPVSVPIDPRVGDVLRRVMILAGDALVTDPDLAAQLADS